MKLARSDDQYRGLLAEMAARRGIDRSANVVPRVFLTPFVNDGRWLVGCPGCGSAQLTAPEVERFLCVECGNVEWDGAEFRLRWPDEHAEVEEALLARKQPRRMNWTEESVADLWVENVAHGVASIDDVPSKHRRHVRAAVKPMAKDRKG